ncbi:hypothetical protein [Desulfosporosinus meridiei]|uniref:hypothetical protein n=1 Tax=Desulfosporosinus meridiei TaxID=79209 RepID=UPI0002313B02|nr:hypothetical protein [Desulfosporosinus meridiei]
MKQWSAGYAVNADAGMINALARRLMPSRQMDTATACRMVGYISDSQFTVITAAFSEPQPEGISLSCVNYPKSEKIQDTGNSKGDNCYYHWTALFQRLIAFQQKNRLPATMALPAVSLLLPFYQRQIYLSCFLVKCLLHS